MEVFYQQRSNELKINVTPSYSVLIWTVPKVVFGSPVVINCYLTLSFPALIRRHRYFDNVRAISHTSTLVGIYLGWSMRKRTVIMSIGDTQYVHTGKRFNLFYQHFFSRILNRYRLYARVLVIRHPSLPTYSNTGFRKTQRKNINFRT